MAGIYIHIPFCHKICSYCDFYRIASVADNRSYINALKKEIGLRADYLQDESVETIYFGGGTPSVMEAGQLNEILKEVKRHHRLDSACEITLEANPDDLSDSYLKSIREITSVNRLSIGIQSFREDDLVLMNRRHTAQEAIQCVDRARRHGFSNISADLIYGIPGSAMPDLSYNLDRLFALDIQHLSAYHLTIEPRTVFFKKMGKGLLTPVKEEESLSQFMYLIECAGHRGFIHYELSNWAKEGYFSKHNTNYWKRKPYLGLGPSAHSYNIVSRQWNVANLNQYLQGIKDGNPVIEKENLSMTTRLNEYLLTSLRTMWGIDMKEIEAVYGSGVTEKLLKGCKKYIGSDHMQKNANTYTLTDEGYFISDTIVSDLMVGEEEGRA